jgi:hypothetical protein
MLAGLSISREHQVLANFSPRLRYGYPGKYAFSFIRNCERVARECAIKANRRQLLQSCLINTLTFPILGLPKCNPRLKFANTFGVSYQLNTHQTASGQG